MKSKMRGKPAMFALGLVAICIVFSAIGQILMKNGMSQVGQVGNWGKLLNLQMFINIFTNGYVIGGLVLYVMSSFLWLGALSTLNVSLAYPLMSLGYVLTAILSLIFLKDNISLVRWLGIAIVIIGCFMIIRK